MPSNPFVEKANRRRAVQHKLAKRNYDELAKILRRFGPDDDPETRERIRLRTEEARKVLDLSPPPTT
jgi:hypothetical protein